jgi:hypothetical protein
MYASITANEYIVYSVNKAFFDPSAKHFLTVKRKGYREDKLAEVLRTFQLAKLGGFKRLNTRDCIDAYAQNL